MSIENEQAVHTYDHEPAIGSSAPLQGTDADNRTSMEKPEPDAPPGIAGKLLKWSEHERSASLARDINYKIGELEQSLEQMTANFSQSQADLKATLTDLHRHNAAMAMDIEQTHSRIGEFGARQNEIANELDQRLRVAVTDLGIQLGQAAQSLQTQQLQLDQLQAGQQSLDALQTRLADFADKQGSKIASMSADASHQIRANKAQFDELNALHGELRSALDLLMESHSGLENRTSDLSGQVDELETGLAQERNRTQKGFRAVTASLAGLVILLASMFGFFQFFPTAVPESVHSQLDSLTSDLSHQSGAINGMMTTLSGLLDRFAGFESSLRQTQQETDALRASFGQSAEDMQQLRADLGGLQRHVDDLRYRVEGPSNRNAGSLVPVVELHDPSWFASRAADHYSIQLVGVYRKQDLVAYINQNAPVLRQEPLAFNQGRHAGRDWYNLFYGDFASFNDARKALDELPLRLRGNNPWIRVMGSIPKAG